MVFAFIGIDVIRENYQDISSLNIILAGLCIGPTLLNVLDLHNRVEVRLMKYFFLLESY